MIASYLLVGLISIQLFMFLFYLTRIISYLREKQYLYFVLISLFWSIYLLCQLCLTFDLPNDSVFYLHKVKNLSLMISCPILVKLLYDLFLTKSKIPHLFMIISYLCIPFVPFDLFTENKISKISNVVFSRVFTYYVAKTNIIYLIFAASMMLTFISSFVFSIIHSIKTKRFNVAVIIFFTSIASGLNDVLTAKQVFSSFFTAEYNLVFIMIFIFQRYLREDKIKYINLLKYSDEIEEQKNKALERLNIIEIYTKKTIVKMIEEGLNPIDIKPSKHNYAILFCDIRNFTTLSELKSTDDIVKILNQYFTIMNEQIRINNGEIDKLIGDCIMALFKTVDDAINAAVCMRKKLLEYNSQGNEIFLDNGIGINFGEVITGNIGSESKLDYTVIGDSVNTASRIENLTKMYGVPLLVSGTVVQNSTSTFMFNKIDTVQLKGKKKPTDIYEILNLYPKETIEIKIKFKKHFQDAYSEYSTGNFKNAYLNFVKLKKILPPHPYYQDRCIDPCIDVFISRCIKLYKLNEIRQINWNGIFKIE